MTKIGTKRKSSKKLTIREYMEKVCPEEKEKILRETRLYAQECFIKNSLIKAISIPFFLPITLDDYLPTMSYVIYNRDLQELSPTGEIINGD